MSETEESMYTKKIGIGIFTFNRPHYLRRLLASLKTQIDVGDCDVHFFCDGAINMHNKQKRAEQKDIDATIQVAHRDVPFKNYRMHIQKQNRSIAIQQYEAYNYMAKSYDFAIWLDDDVELGRHWVRVARMLATKVDEDPTLISGTPGFQRWCAKGEEQDHLDEYQRAQSPWIGYIMDMRMWPELQKIYQDYYDLVRVCDYRSRPHGKIKALYQKHGWTKGATSQDCAKEESIKRLGWDRIRTIVNRGRYIGEHGEHGRPGIYAAQGWKNYWTIDWEKESEVRDLRQVDLRLKPCT